VMILIKLSKDKINSGCEPVQLLEVILQLRNAVIVPRLPRFVFIETRNGIRMYRYNAH